MEALPVAARGRGRLLAVGGAVLALAASLGAWRLGLVPNGTRADAGIAPRAAAPRMGALLPLEPFIANLADRDGRRSLKATLQVEFFAPEVPDEVGARLPQVRELLLTLITGKALADIRTPEGRAQLRDEIVARLNQTLGTDLVKAVYFTEFIVR